MSPSVSRCVATVAAGLLCALLLPAQAAVPVDGKRLPNKVTFIDAPSSESPEARKKRLKKECAGRPNAGACLGHVR